MVTTTSIVKWNAPSDGKNAEKNPIFFKNSLKSILYGDGIQHSTACKKTQSEYTEHTTFSYMYHTNAFSYIFVQLT